MRELLVLLFDLEELIVGCWRCAVEEAAR